MRELEVKTARLVSLLESEGLDGVVLNAQHNFAWLTSGGTNGIDLSRENGAASLMVTRDGKRFVLASSIEMPRMLAEQVASEDFEPVEYSWQDEKADGALVLKKARQIAGTRIATDIAMFADAPPIEDKIAACRYRLTTDEIERYRQLGRDAGAAMTQVVGRIATGDREAEIAETVRHQLATQGITSVVTLVAVDDRISKFRHPVPTTERWEKTLLLVTCAKRYGLIASLSRMVSAGEPSDELKPRTDAAAYVNASLLDATRHGVSGGDLYRTAERAYEKTGFADEIDRHHQGGATGYRTRDWVAHRQSADIVQPLQAFAWNPSITGTKVEDTIICGEEGIEIMTESADVPAIETVIGDRTYYTPGIIVC